MRTTCLAWITMVTFPVAVWADEPAGRPAMRVASPDVPSVYAPPAPPSPTDGVNQGGVHIDLRVNYMTDYVFRGIEILEVPASEDVANLQVEAKLQWDLGRLPSP